MLSFENVFVDEYTVVAAFVVQTTALLDEDGRYADRRHNEHGNEPGKLAKTIENTMNPTNDTPIAAAASIRKRPRIPINSSGFCNPLKTG